MAGTPLTLVLKPAGTSHFYCQSILGLCSCGNKLFFRSSLFNLASVCVWGGAYINVVFLTCLACFRLASNECAEKKGLWFFWSVVARRAGFFSSLNRIRDSWQQPFSLQWNMWRKAGPLPREGAPCVSFHVLVWWFPHGGSKEEFLHIYAASTT